MANVILSASACPQCGEGGGGGECADGEECLPDDFVAPCDEGSECLPSTFIDPDDCPAGESACLTANEDDADATILALSPFAYYPMDDASGDPQDISGNGNHATGTAATVTYAQAALSAKAGDAISVSARGQITLPNPYPAGNGLAEIGNAWTIAMLVRFDADKATGGGDDRAVLLQEGALTVWRDYPTNATDHSGDNVLTWYSSDGEKGIRTTEPAVALGDPIVLVLQGESRAIRMFVNGALVGSATRANTGGNTDITFGGFGGFWGAADFTVSNVAVWDRALTDAEIGEVSNVLADDDIVSSTVFGGCACAPAGDSVQMLSFELVDATTHAFDFVGGSHEIATTVGLSSGDFDLVIVDAVAGEVVLLGFTCWVNIGGYRPRHDFSLLVEGVHDHYIGEPIAVAAGFSVSANDFAEVNAIGITALFGDASGSEIIGCWQTYEIQSGDISLDGTVTFRAVHQGTGTFVTNQSFFPFTIGAVYPYAPT